MVEIVSFKKLISQSKIGDEFVVDAADSSTEVIQYTKQLLREGKIAPKDHELLKLFYPGLLHDLYRDDRVPMHQTYVVMS